MALHLQSSTHKLHISPTFTKPSTTPPTRKKHTIFTQYALKKTKKIAADGSLVNPKNHKTTRRAIALTISSSSFLFLQSRKEAIAGIDLRMTEPDQTLEEAQSTIKEHAKGLLKVKELLEEEDDEYSWKEAQRALRKMAALLKQDIYTLIQGKPGSERPQLRKMYSVLFNSVSNLDYAARDKDVTRAWESYHDVVMALDDILPRLLP